MDDVDAGTCAFAPGAQVEVEIETPRFGFIKRRADGGIDFISPIPSLFHYGFRPGTTAGDGDPQDAVVLADCRLVRGQRIRVKVAGRVRFVDGGCRDDKLICCAPGRQVTRSDVRQMKAFFFVYTILKRGLGYWRGKYRKTVFEGIYIG